jgi:site-specific DNA-methyltransferase (adenine-specific)
MNEIIQADFNDLLVTIEDNSIDLICIDPPYEINYQNLSWDGINLDWDYIIYDAFRVLKDTGNFITFQGWSNVCNLLNLVSTQKKTNFKLQNWIIWDRIKGRGAKRNFVSTREDILWFTKSDNYTFNIEDSTIKKKTSGMGKKNGSEYRRLSNCWHDLSPIVPWSKEKLDHPTQKPLALIERIVRVFSNEGDTVLDCFCGSGTVAEACKNLNRNYICSDEDEKYVKMTMERVNA